MYPTDGLNVLSARALPWADGPLPLRGVIGYIRIIRFLSFIT